MEEAPCFYCAHVELDSLRWVRSHSRSLNSPLLTADAQWHDMGRNTCRTTSDGEEDLHHTLCHELELRYPAAGGLAGSLLFYSWTPTEGQYLPPSRQVIPLTSL